MIKNLASCFFTLLLFLTSHFSLAQSKLTEGRHKMNRTVFKINKLENGMAILEENTKIKQGKEYDAKLWYGLNTVVYVSKDDVKSAFVKVIGSKRISELSPKGNVSISVILNKVGKPSEVSYFLREDSGLTLEELDRLTAYIKDNIVVKMPDVPINKLATFSNVILFDRIGK